MADALMTYEPALIREKHDQPFAPGPPIWKDERTVDTLRRVRNAFRRTLVGLEHLLAAYFSVQMEPLRIHAWTLLDARDEETERRIAEAERMLIRSFPDIGFDFTTVHLQGRDPRQFIPQRAYGVKIRRLEPSLIQMFADTQADAES
jgi:hypothetical protein